MLIANKDIEQAQVIGISVGVLDIRTYDESIAGLNGVVSIFNNMGALAVEDDDQFDKVMLVQGAIGLICFTAGDDALVGHLKPGGNRFIASTYYSFFTRCVDI